MRRMDAPNVGVAEALNMCVPHKNQEVRERLEQVRGSLVAAEADYIERGPVATLYQINPVEDVAGIVSGDEMASLYTDTFARLGTQSRDLYDKIKQGAPNGICPLCGGQHVATLDHYLAKTKHVLLTITPANLIPCCSDCNKAKGSDDADEANEQHLHPYYDDVDDVVWLYAEVVESSPPSLRYMVDPPLGWNDPKPARVKKHFTKLKHGLLFASLSSDHLPSMRKRLRRLLASGGPEAVREHLQEDLEGHQEERRNSWQIAMYTALIRSDWYCGGGFDA